MSARAPVRSATIDSWRVALAANIQAERTRARLSVRALASGMRALGFDNWYHQTVSMVELGQRRVQAEEVYGLAVVLGVAVSVLMRELACPPPREGCCDLHGRNCEPPSESCCEDCTELDHPGHTQLRPCSNPDLSAGLRQEGGTT